VFVLKTWFRFLGCFPAQEVDGTDRVRTVRPPPAPSALWAGKRIHFRDHVLTANSHHRLFFFRITVCFFLFLYRFVVAVGVCLCFPLWRHILYCSVCGMVLAPAVTQLVKSRLCNVWAAMFPYSIRDVSSRITCCSDLTFFSSLSIAWVLGSAFAAPWRRI
jgi:hypothetical protein